MPLPEPKEQDQHDESHSCGKQHSRPESTAADCFTAGYASSTCGTNGTQEDRHQKNESQHDEQGVQLYTPPKMIN